MGFVFGPPEYAGMNYILSDNTISKVPYVYYKPSQSKEVRIPPGATIKIVIMWGNTNGYFYGIQLFDAA